MAKTFSRRRCCPDGTTKTLIHIKHWDVNWQAVYRYAEPVFLPKNTVLKMRYVYDNSEANTANPNHPPARVLGGNLATDEMAHLWLQVLPKSDPSRPGDPRMVLQEAWARHEVEKAPNSFESRYNLGEMLQARGELDEAIEQFQAAVAVRPTDAVANNALGGALLAKGDLAGSVKCFNVALTSQPDYFDAHYNLGNALAAQGDFSGAAEQFGDAAKLNPDDANTQANLGTALVQLGRLGEAKSHYEAALRIDPSNQLARDNSATTGAVDQGTSAVITLPRVIAPQWLRRVASVALVLAMLGALPAVADDPQLARAAQARCQRICREPSLYELSRRDLSIFFCRRPCPCQWTRDRQPGRRRIQPPEVTGQVSRVFRIRKSVDEF